MIQFILKIYLRFLAHPSLHINKYLPKKKMNKFSAFLGVFVTTMEPRENTFLQQSEEDYEIMQKSTWKNTKNMDILTRNQCPVLDHFVVFSSVIANHGISGQSIYAMFNFAIERLCEKRCREKLPGLAIQWGPINATGSPECSSVTSSVRPFKNISLHLELLFT